MSRRTLGPHLVVWLALAAAAGAARPEIAARIDGDPVPTEELDARSAPKATLLLERAREAFAEATDALIAERLLASAADEIASVPSAVTEGEIDAFLRGRAEDFEGPFAPTGSAREASVQREAVRHYLEEQRGERLRAERVATLAAERGVRRALPSSDELAASIAPERAVAHVGETPILAGEVEERAALRLYRIRGELARERLRQLGSLIDARLLERAARRQGRPVEQLVAVEARVSDAEVDAFLASERAAGRSVTSRERARPYLEFRKREGAREELLARLRREARIEVALREPAPPRFPTETDGAPVLGGDAGLLLVAYTNYRCRSCRLTHRELDRLIEGEPATRIAFRDWIPSYDPAAREAAGLARCADRQGRFAAMRAELLRREPPDFGARWFRGDAGLRELARAAGADPAALRRCLDAGAADAAIDADTAAARAFGFETAPAFLAEGIPLTGVQTAERLAEALRAPR